MFPELFNEIKKLKQLLEESRRIVVVHHWDVDGIASYALIYRVFNAKGFKLIPVVPRIGFYSFDAIPYKSIEHYRPDLLLVLDYGIGCRDLEMLNRLFSLPVAVVDHHRNEVCGIDVFLNPVARGSQELDYPATTYILSKIFDVGEDLAALAIVGDLSTYVEVSSWRTFVEQKLREYGYGLRDSYRITRVVDVCYQIVDERCFDIAREALLQGIDHVMRCGELAYFRKLLDEELYRLYEEIVHNPVKIIDDKVHVFEAKSKYYIVSHLGRKLADTVAHGIVVLKHYVESLGRSYIYVRSHRYRLDKALGKLKNMDMIVGGKDRVFVVTCRSTECPELEKVLQVLKESLG